MRGLLASAAIALSSCAWKPTPTLAPVEQDRSIVFPESFGSTSVVGRPGQSFAMDGVTAQALMIAANDFLGPISKDTPCWGRRDAYDYQVLRQNEVIFIEIHADPKACEGQFLMLDSGVRYAINVHGRILRRLQSGEPEWPVPAPAPTDAGVREVMDELDVSAALEARDGGSPPHVPWMQPDGGTPVDGGIGG